MATGPQFDSWNRVATGSVTGMAGALPPGPLPTTMASGLGRQCSSRKFGVAGSATGTPLPQGAVGMRSHADASHPSFNSTATTTDVFHPVDLGPVLTLIANANDLQKANSDQMKARISTVESTLLQLTATLKETASSKNFRLLATGHLHESIHHERQLAKRNKKQRDRLTSLMRAVEDGKISEMDAMRLKVLAIYLSYQS